MSVIKPTRAECETTLFTSYPKAERVMTCEAEKLNGEWVATQLSWQTRDRRNWESQRTWQGRR